MTIMTTAGSIVILFATGGPMAATHDVTDTASGNGALRTKAEDVAGIKADKTVYETLELSDARARIDANAAVVTGVNHITGKTETGETFDVKLAFTDTYIRRHGRWYVWASQHTRVR